MQQNRHVLNTVRKACRLAKLPSFMFYPGDWLRDPVSGCSLAAQGLWLRLMILMHDAERYGYLAINGSPIPSDQLARRCGCSLAEFEVLFAELESAGIPRRTKDAIIYSKRMSDDAEDRAKNAERQRRHYEKTHTNTNGQPNGNLTASSRKPNNPSSSSVSSSEREESTNVDAGAKAPRARAPDPPSHGNQQQKPSEGDLELYKRRDALISHLKVRLKTDTLPDLKKQKSAALWLVKHYSDSQCFEVLDHQWDTEWREKADWQTVKQDIAQYFARKDRPMKANAKDAIGAYR